MLWSDYVYLVVKVLKEGICILEKACCKMHCKNTHYRKIKHWPHINVHRLNCYYYLVLLLLLWPALRYGTGYQTVWETRPSAETPSDVHWRRFYFQLTCVHSALELSGRCALQIYLLRPTHIHQNEDDCKSTAAPNTTAPIFTFLCYRGVV